MATLTLEVGNLFEELDHLGVEKQLRHEAGVSRATANPAGGSVTVEYDPAQTDGTRLQSLIKSCGFRCRGGIMPKHVCKPAEANLSESGTGPGRGADSRGEQAVHHDHRQGGAKDEMAQEMGHGAGMDMQEMVRDMRNRFWIAFIFTIPIFIYSPMGGFFTPPAPPFGMNLELFLFGLASAAVLYPVWPFVVAAWRALRNGILNMAVLVVLSVGTGYLFSVGSTFFFPGVQFYEAVAILLVFILLGHWLEMRARAHFQPVPEEDEHEQDGDGLIELHAGKEKCRSDAEEIAGADRKHDKHGHIENAIAKGAPCSDHKWPDRIEHGRARQAEQKKLKIHAERRGRRSEKPAHRGVDENRDREDEGNPETVAHVAYHLLHVHACPVAHFLGHFVLRPALAVVVVNCLFSPAVRTAPRSRAGFRKICFRRFTDMLRHDAATAAETAAFDQALKPRPIGLRRVVFHGHAAPRGVCSGSAYAGFMPQLLLHAEVIEFFKEISDF